MFEAGASSGLMAALFTGGIALPHIAAHGHARPRRPVRPADPGRRDDRVAGGHRARRRLRRRRHHARRAERDGDEYVVNGAKTFITSGVRADFVTAAVRTGGPGHARDLAAGVEKGTPGFTVDRSLSKMGWHCSDTAELGFADVRVPVAQPGRRGEHRLRPDRRAVRGRADRAGRARLRHRRPGRSPSPRRTCRSARRSAVRWSANQVVRHQLVEMHRQVEVARTYTRAVAARHVAGEDVVAEACLAKKTAVDTAAYVCDQAVQLHGGAGYLHGTEVERHYRDARILRHRRRSDRGARATWPPGCWGTRHE